MRADSFKGTITHFVAPSCLFYQLERQTGCICNVLQRCQSSDNDPFIVRPAGFHRMPFASFCSLNEKHPVIELRTFELCRSFLSVYVKTTRDYIIFLHAYIFVFAVYDPNLVQLNLALCSGVKDGQFTILQLVEALG